MSRINKTGAVVLSVVKYSDSSKIASLFTRDYGKVSVIVKGGRQKSSKEGRIVDPLNHIQAIFYLKESREVQTLSSADLIEHYPGIREDYDCMKYSLAIAELTSYLTMENEVNERLYNGLNRILKRIETRTELPLASFLRFFMFILSESGFDINMDNCQVCGSLFDVMPAGFSNERGMICNSCTRKAYTGLEINSELFTIMYCLKKGKAINTDSESYYDRIYQMLDRFSAFHLPGYKPLNALKM